MRRKGYFITFEGGEGSGKSTHIRSVASYLRKKKWHVLVLREPGGTRVGEQIRKVLLDRSHKTMTVETELFLFLAARAQLVRDVITPALTSGKVVLCDRFEDSTVVYQGFAGGLNVNQLKKTAKAARGSVTPNLTFLLDVPAREGLRRSGRRDRMERKSRQFHERIRRGYLKLARQNKRRFTVVSTTETQAEVRKRILMRLKHVFG